MVISLTAIKLVNRKSYGDLTLDGTYLTISALFYVSRRYKAFIILTPRVNVLVNVRMNNLKPIHYYIVSSLVNNYNILL